MEHLTLENLRKCKDCIIVTADKGVALVVMDKTEYITKCEALPQDNSVYQNLSKDISPTIHKELIKILQDYQNNNFISETEYTLLRHHGSNSPAARFMVFLKSTKNDMPMCPIVSTCGTATFTLTNCICSFNKKFYKQLQGAAMGSPVSPVIANIYMEYFESLAIPSCPTSIK